VHTSENFRHLFMERVSYDLLLAIDDDQLAPAAIRLTHALAARGAVPHVLRTLELLISEPPGAMLLADVALGEDYKEQEARLLSTLSAITGDNCTWPITVVPGDAPSSILVESRAKAVDLIVMGVQHHGALAQAFGENTASRVMAKAAMPVIGVRPSSLRSCRA